MKFQAGLFNGCVYVGTTGTWAVSVRVTSLAVVPVGFLTFPTEVRLHVDWPVTVCVSVPHHSTVPPVYVSVVCVTVPSVCSPSRYLLRALFWGFERTAIISLMPASARS